MVEPRKALVIMMESMNIEKANGQHSVLMNINFHLRPSLLLSCYASE